MKTVSAIALRPLDGQPRSATWHELPQNIFDELKARGVVKAAPKRRPPRRRLRRQEGDRLPTRRRPPANK
jgi:hypothetical protein